MLLARVLVLRDEQSGFISLPISNSVFMTWWSRYQYLISDHDSDLLSDLLQPDLGIQGSEDPGTAADKCIWATTAIVDIDEEKIDGGD